LYDSLLHTTLNVLFKLFVILDIRTFDQIHFLDSYFRIKYIDGIHMEFV
jgi:hypothetical protein